MAELANSSAMQEILQTSIVVKSTETCDSESQG